MDKSDNILPNQVIMHFFSNVVGIKCNGTSLYSFIEPKLKDSSKWRNILNKGRPITERSLKKLIDALSSKRAKLSAKHQNIATHELEALTQTLLWRAMQTNLSHAQLCECKRLLPINIQMILSRKNENTGNDQN
jgi:hypothetical protein